VSRLNRLYDFMDSVDVNAPKEEVFKQIMELPTPDPQEPEVRARVYKETVRLTAEFRAKILAFEETLQGKSAG
jgi:hypothetical protein